MENLAKAYVKQDDNASAIKYYKQALVLNPGSRSIKEKLKELGVEPESPDVSMTPPELELYAATYGIEGAFDVVDVDITFEDGKLFASALNSGEPKRQMLPMAEDRFYFEASPLQMSFERDAFGMVLSMTVHQGSMTWFRRKKPPGS